MTVTAGQTVAVTGTSGLVGQLLCAQLAAGGHRVIRLVRKVARGDGERYWDCAAPAGDLLEGVDAVIHLAGEPIGKRFTARHMAAIADSRIGPTKHLAALAGQAGVSTFICASAIGFYGAHPGVAVDETSARGNDFLADVVARWERACAEASQAGARVVMVRTGVALSARAGYLRQVLPIFRLGLGGRLGNGRQILSWIALDDLTGVYLRCLTDRQLSGPVNAVAPHPVSATEFAHTLGSVLHRPTLLPVPAFAPALLLGRRGARELALADQQVRPAALARIGFGFRYPHLRAALSAIVER